MVLLRTGEALVTVTVGDKSAAIPFIVFSDLQHDVYTFPGFVGDSNPENYLKGFASTTFTYDFLQTNYFVFFMCMKVEYPIYKGRDELAAYIHAFAYLFHLAIHTKQDMFIQA